MSLLTYYKLQFQRFTFVGLSHDHTEKLGNSNDFS